MAISSHAVIAADRGDVDHNEWPAPLTNEEFLKVSSGTSELRDVRELRFEPDRDRALFEVYSVFDTLKAAPGLATHYAPGKQRPLVRLADRRPGPYYARTAPAASSSAQRA